MGKKIEVSGWVRKALDAVPLPPAPAAEQWEMSLAAFLRLRTDIPTLALKPLGLLDRYGALGFGPETVGFDGEDIAWGRVIRIVARDVVEVMSDSAMEREAEHIRGLLPPLPGRKWVVEQVMGLIGHVAGPVTAKVTAGDVACEIVYRGKFGREKTLQAGLFPALLQASRPQILRSLVATARERGVEVSGLRKAAVAAAVDGVAIPAQDAVAIPTQGAAAAIPASDEAVVPLLEAAGVPVAAGAAAAAVSNNAVGTVDAGDNAVGAVDDAGDAVEPVPGVES